VLIRQKLPGNFSSLLLLASLAMLFLPLGPYAYWTRAEPFLIFISALALLVAIRLRPMAAGTIIGVLAGLATGFKLHGFIYVAPMAIMTLARANSLHDRVVLASTGVACAAITVLLPFCLKESSLVGYWEYLKIAAHHPSPPGAFSV